MPVRRLRSGLFGKPPGPMLDAYEQVLNQHRVFVIADGDTLVAVLVLIVGPSTCFATTSQCDPPPKAKGWERC